MPEREGHKNIDGDTFVIESRERVRMIGINAPEKSDLYGSQATNHLYSLIANKYVVLTMDKQTSERYVYGRLLRGVNHNNTDINKRMVQDRYAFAYLKYKFKKSQEYTSAQLFAKERGLGIWHTQNKLIKANNLGNWPSKRVLILCFLLFTLTCTPLYYTFKAK